MNQNLKPGERLQTENGRLSCQIRELLGSGGQGDVYRADLDGKAVAVKWYFQHTATPYQLECLQRLVQRDAPDSRFLWPIDIVRAPGRSEFGYLMPLRDARFKGMEELVLRRVTPTFRVLTVLGFNLADAFLQLHSNGLCYRDISFGNVFFDPKSGEICICDNDNVTVNRDPKCSINGTARFMAPEIVRGEAKPSINSDLYSLAVLLFYTLMFHHPLEGKRESQIHCLDQAAMTKIYGTHPLFVFDPKDHSNEPVCGYHDNALIFWPIYPTFLRDRFLQAFTKGLHDPENGREAEGAWRADMIRLRDSIVYCAHCSAHNFYDVDVMKATGGKLNPCWRCKKDIQSPPRIRIGKDVVLLNHDSQLFPHHIDPERHYDFSAPIARVTHHPNNAGTWGLCNLTDTNWVAVLSDGKMHSIEPQRNVKLSPGLRIQFGKVDGEIRF